jgi:hypothetical protein
MGAQVGWKLRTIDPALATLGTHHAADAPTHSLSATNAGRSTIGTGIFPKRTAGMIVTGSNSKTITGTNRPDRGPRIFEKGSTMQHHLSAELNKRLNDTVARFVTANPDAKLRTIRNGLDDAITDAPEIFARAQKDAE